MVSVIPVYSTDHHNPRWLILHHPSSGCFISACVWRIRKAREGTEGAPDTADLQPSSPSRGVRERRRFRQRGRFQPSCYWQESSVSIFTFLYWLKYTIHTSHHGLKVVPCKCKVRRCCVSFEMLPSSRRNLTKLGEFIKMPMNLAYHFPGILARHS